MAQQAQHCRRAPQLLAAGQHGSRQAPQLQPTLEARAATCCAALQCASASSDPCSVLFTCLPCPATCTPPPPPSPACHRALFKTHPLEHSIENQWSFLAQRFGGPTLFNELEGGEPAAGGAMPAALRPLPHPAHTHQLHAAASFATSHVQLLPAQPARLLLTCLASSSQTTAPSCLTGVSTLHLCAALTTGPAQMLRRHEEYPCNDTTAERWLHHSQIAFEQVGCPPGWLSCRGAAALPPVASSLTVLDGSRSGLCVRSLGAGPHQLPASGAELQAHRPHTQMPSRCPRLTTTRASAWSASSSGWPTSW